MPATRPDRLSALIRQFRIDATVHRAVDDGGWRAEKDNSAPNLFIARQGGLVFADPRFEELSSPEPMLAFFPRGAPPDLQVRMDATDTQFVRATVDMGGDANPIARALPTLMTIPLAKSEPLRSVADMLLEEALSPRCGGRAVVDRLCEVVVIRLLRYAIEAGQTKPGLLAGLAHPSLCLAIIAVHDSPGRNWHLEDLANIAGMSRTHFANTFRIVMGMTPGEYLSNWRLALARTEIAKGAPLKAVAGRVGFSSSAALSRAFSRRYGVSPKEEYARARQQAAVT
jgi:AraC-like DNA-binding protein